MDNKLQKNQAGGLKEKTQYVLTFGVIAAMLYVAQFPMLVIFFFGIFAYFLWKTFSKPSRQGVREIFEFYLSANEILRDDERRWFGFEVQEVVSRGEKILKTMNGAPPLVYFALGALYNKSGNHKAAVEHLEFVVDNERSDEATYLHPSGDLRNYVRVLRKIEREPVEAPQMSAAVRSLERARRNRVAIMLEESRERLAAEERVRAEAERKSLMSAVEEKTEEKTEKKRASGPFERKPETKSAPPPMAGEDKPRPRRRKSLLTDEDDIHANRKPISEVLHDIYDKNIQ